MLMFKYPYSNNIRLFVLHCVFNKSKSRLNDRQRSNLANCARLANFLLKGLVNRQNSQDMGPPECNSARE